MTRITPTYPEPIDPSYRPKVSIAKVPATTPIEYILAIIERDGGVILEDFASAAELDAISNEVKPWSQVQRQSASDNPSAKTDAFTIMPEQTIIVPGLVGKSKTAADICEKPILEELRQNILTEKFNVHREDFVEPNTIDPLLSVSMCMNIGHGAPRQRLHRDDNVHGIRHSSSNWSFKKVSQFACLIAGCEVTRENGATMFVPGSHKWDDDRRPALDEVSFAGKFPPPVGVRISNSPEMSSGSALIFLASCYHGGGHNAVPNFIRTMHSFFFIRGTLRTEENQFLAVPRSKILQMSPKMLELLGYKKPTIPLGTVEGISPHDDLEGIWKAAMQ